MRLVISCALAAVGLIFALRLNETVQEPDKTPNNDFGSEASSTFAVSISAAKDFRVESRTPSSTRQLDTVPAEPWIAGGIRRVLAYTSNISVVMIALASKKGFRFFSASLQTMVAAVYLLIEIVNVVTKAFPASRFHAAMLLVFASYPPFVHAFYSLIEKLAAKVGAQGQQLANAPDPNEHTQVFDRFVWWPFWIPVLMSVHLALWTTLLVMVFPAKNLFSYTSYDATVFQDLGNSIRSRLPALVVPALFLLSCIVCTCCRARFGASQEAEHRWKSFIALFRSLGLLSSFVLWVLLLETFPPISHDAFTYDPGQLVGFLPPFCQVTTMVYVYSDLEVWKRLIDTLQTCGKATYAAMVEFGKQAWFMFVGLAWGIQLLAWSIGNWYQELF